MNSKKFTISLNGTIQLHVYKTKQKADHLVKKACNKDGLTT